MDTDMTISLCMIVKNEAAYMEECLRSVHDVVDEIIIVDTGSKDQTRDICRKYGAKVIEYEWNNHFAAARNESIKHAVGDWILYLDADELLDTERMPNFKEELGKSKEVLIHIAVLNYVGDRLSKNPDGTFIYHQPRLFRNHLGIYFEGRIHETLKLPQSLLDGGFGYLPLIIHHHGYLHDRVRNKNKSQRNMELLGMEKENMDANPWIGYHLANEFYRLEDYVNAFEYINQSIIRFLLLGQKPPSLIYRLKYAILLETGNIEGAYPAIEKAIELYPDYVDLHYCKGLLLYQKGDYEDALNAFEECLLLGEDNKQYLVLKGAGTFKAEEYKKKCLQKLYK